MANRINLDTNQMGGKIGELKTIQSSLNGELQVANFAFGPCAQCESTGSAAEQLALVSADLNICADKFAALVGATIQYLQGVQSTFEEADSAIGV